MFANRGGPWLLGDWFTLADVCVAPLPDRMEDIGLANLWYEYPAVGDWLARSQLRPAYGEASPNRLSEQYAGLGLGRADPRRI